MYFKNIFLLSVSSQAYNSFTKFYLRFKIDNFKTCKTISKKTCSKHKYSTIYVKLMYHDRVICMHVRVWLFPITFKIINVNP